MLVCLYRLCSNEAEALVLLSKLVLGPASDCLSFPTFSEESWKPEAGWYPASGAFGVALQAGSWGFGYECRAMGQKLHERQCPTQL